jgi:hypothetical protein
MQELTNSIKRPQLKIMGIEEGKKYKQKEFIIYSTNNNRKFLKSTESYAHPGTGNLQDTKQT